MVKRELTEEEKQERRKKRNEIAKKRDQKIRELMAENEKILGKKVMKNTQKEAEDMLIAMNDEFLSQMTEKEIDEILDNLENRSRNNRKRYANRQKAKDEEFLKEHENSSEIIQSYLLARKVTNSAERARKMVENNSLEEVEKIYRAYRDEDNRKKALSAKKAKTQKTRNR